MITGLLQSLACLNAKTLPYLLRYLSMQNSDGCTVVLASPWWCNEPLNEGRVTCTYLLKSGPERKRGCKA
ncbi:hypothetical protein M404DRAFT_598684 [Pisolithus tinctorius Marx 270]|uniref:Uncharacterized protein n=1 Tax=Pisolithus tinctorius Marx 270 TaxID=870435 RepID=A0A0C3NSZ9_PISTI|nr:hypothetical protein M404DRAFT_598684 [Pisolithus tinctorius Marx 270]